MAGNALAVLKGSLRAEHGGVMAGEVSDHAVVSQVARVYPGMMKAVPPRQWPELSDRPVQRWRTCSTSWRRGCRWSGCSKAARTEEAETAAKQGGANHHLATKKLLDEAKGIRPPRAK